MNLQRQIMEQKMKQKRLTSGMIQASDVRTNSAKTRNNSASRRELHGRCKMILNSFNLILTLLFS